ncbi:hypothetical protein D2E16_11150 [Streptococcus suis]|nr:hypothetical protein D2E16_11150 [Streptococcus suis]
MADLFVFYTPNLTSTTDANSVRFISNLQRFPEPLELCGDGSKIVQWTILARTYCLEVRGTLFDQSSSFPLPFIFLRVCLVTW